MANPQAENGHVDIANEIVETLAKTQLSGYESRVLWIIFRKTYGWHKKEDWITNTQIARMTGIAESHISRTIKMLIKRKIVTKIGKKISFQKDYDKWKKLPKLVSIKKLPIQDKKLPKLVNENTKIGKKSIPKLVDTKEIKETSTKEIITKEKGTDFTKTWKDFREMRKKNRKPMTKRAEELIIKELNKLSKNKDVQIAILNQSIMNSWQGVFPLKEIVNNTIGEGDDIKEKKIKKLTDDQIEANKQRISKLVKGFKDKFDIEKGGS